MCIICKSYNCMPDKLSLKFDTSTGLVILFLRWTHDINRWKHLLSVIFAASKFYKSWSSQSPMHWICNLILHHLYRCVHPWLSIPWSTLKIHTNSRFQFVIIQAHGLHSASTSCLQCGWEIFTTRHVVWCPRLNKSSHFGNNRHPLCSTSFW